MVKAHFSQNYWAVQKRVKRLPQLAIGQMKAAAKRDGAGLIKGFQEGIQQQTLHLRRLKSRTVDRKEAKGWDQPDTPLYGIGFRDPRTYVNMLENVKVGDRMYIVRPKAGLHRADPDEPRKHRIKLRDLFDVHEYGTTITNGFGRGIFIRIPARPALRYAYRRYMRERAKADPAVAVRAAIGRYIQLGDAQALERIRRKMERGFQSLKGPA